MNPSVRWLHNGRRLHLQHGPIDLIIEVNGKSSAVERAAYQRAIDRFETVLTELVAELTALRTRTDIGYCAFEGSIARRMWQAANGCEQKASQNTVSRKITTTPMIAVAGSVADEVLGAIVGNADDAERLNKVCVNNGGDIAIYLDANSGYRVGVVANPDDARISASLALHQSDGINGIATSGWRGRSFSMGIADSVTVLAANAATADAAATLIANAVDFEASDDLSEDICTSRFVVRKPANELDPDSDLGSTLVTTNVLYLPSMLVELSLDAASEVAARLERQGLIAGACIFLQSDCRVVGKTFEPVVHQLADTKAVEGSEPAVRTCPVQVAAPGAGRPVARQATAMFDNKENLIPTGDFINA